MKGRCYVKKNDKNNNKGLPEAESRSISNSVVSISYKMRKYSPRLRKKYLFSIHYSRIDENQNGILQRSVYDWRSNYEFGHRSQPIWGDCRAFAEQQRDVETWQYFSFLILQRFEKWPTSIHFTKWCHKHEVLPRKRTHEPLNFKIPWKKTCGFILTRNSWTPLNFKVLFQVFN